MNIDWSSFTPSSALLGGVLIGLATTLLVLGIGRIAGISGIAASLSQGDASNRPQRAWRALFLFGLVVAPIALHGLPSAIAPISNPLRLLLAGLLVGVGTRLAGGCTSGHGVCGLSRQSARSLVATLSFIGAGVATVWLVGRGHG